MAGLWILSESSSWRRAARESRSPRRCHIFFCTDRAGYDGDRFNAVRLFRAISEDSAERDSLDESSAFLIEGAHCPLVKLNFFFHYPLVKLTWACRNATHCNKTRNKQANIGKTTCCNDRTWTLLGPFLLTSLTAKKKCQRKRFADVQWQTAWIFFFRDRTLRVKDVLRKTFTSQQTDW